MESKEKYLDLDVVVLTDMRKAAKRVNLSHGHFPENCQPKLYIPSLSMMFEGNHQNLVISI